MVSGAEPVDTVSSLQGFEAECLELAGTHKLSSNAYASLLQG
jgi:hypothetical protein